MMIGHSKPGRHALGATAAAAMLALGGLATAALPASAQYSDDRPSWRDRDYSDPGYDRGPTYGGEQDYGRDGAYNGDRGYDDARGTPGDDEPDVSFFYDELEGEGRWVSHPRYGYVWTPRGTDADWRPYSRGYWADTDEHGWYWVSDEPWGWATYHYGRWFHDDRFGGWLWVPGTKWGPAWVAWRSSDDYVGWAPLPPDAYWDERAGLRFDAAVYESPRFSFMWSFVQPQYIATPGVYRYFAPSYRVRTIIYRTRPETKYVWINNRIVNYGIPRNRIERFFKVPLRKVKIYAVEGRYARGRDRWAGDTIRIWRPNFSRRYGLGTRRDRPGWQKELWHNVDRWTEHDRIREHPRHPNRTGYPDIKTDRSPTPRTSPGFSLPRPPATPEWKGDGQAYRRYKDDLRRDRRQDESEQRRQRELQNHARPSNEPPPPYSGIEPGKNENKGGEKRLKERVGDSAPPPSTAAKDENKKAENKKGEKKKEDKRPESVVP